MTIAQSIMAVDGVGRAENTETAGINSQGYKDDPGRTHGQSWVAEPGAQ